MLGSGLLQVFRERRRAALAIRDQQLIADRRVIAQAHAPGGGRSGQVPPGRRFAAVGRRRGGGGVVERAEAEGRVHHQRGMVGRQALVPLLVLVSLVAVGEVADRLDDDPMHAVPIGCELDAHRLHVASDSLLFQLQQAVAMVLVVDQPIAGQERTQVQGRPSQAGVGVRLAGLVQVIEALKQHRRGRRLVAAQVEGAVGVDAAQFVAADAGRDQYVADLLLGRIDAEGDADTDDGARLPVGDGVVGGVLGLALALAADSLYDLHTAVVAEQVVDDAVGGRDRRLAVTVKARDDCGGLVVIESQEHDDRQVNGGQAALVGHQLGGGDGVQLAGIGEARSGRRDRWRTLEPDPAVGRVGLLVRGHRNPERAVLGRGGVVDLAKQPVERCIRTGPGVGREQVRVDARERNPAIGFGLGQGQQTLGEAAKVVLKRKLRQAGTGVVGGQRGRHRQGPRVVPPPSINWTGARSSRPCVVCRRADKGRPIRQHRWHQLRAAPIG